MKTSALKKVSLLKRIHLLVLPFMFSASFAAAVDSVEKAKLVTPPKTEMATFAAGCFWGTEEFFRKIPGVKSTEVGYSGGTTTNPLYDEMHDGHTGHAESVNVEFDPAQVSYEKLLDQFFKMHDQQLRTAKETTQELSTVQRFSFTGQSR